MIRAVLVGCWPWLAALPGAAALAQARARLPLPGNVLYTDATHARKQADARAASVIEGAPITIIQGHARAAAGQRRRRPRAAPRGRPRRASTRRRSARATTMRAASSRPNCGRGRAPGRAQARIQQRRARAPGRRAQLPEVPGPCGRPEGRHRAQGKRHRRASSASWPSCRLTAAAADAAQGLTMNADLPPGASTPSTMLATMVAVVRSRRPCLLANAALENAVGCRAARCCAAACSTGSSTPLPMRETLRGGGSATRSPPAASRRAAARAAGRGRAAAGARDRHPDRHRRRCWSRCSRSSSRPGRTARSARSTRRRPTRS